MKHRILWIIMALFTALSGCSKASPEHQEKQNELLMEAVNHKDFKQARKALRRGADPNIENRFGDEIIFLAIIKKDLKMVQLLVEKGADLQATDENRNQPLTAAAIAKDPDIVRYLLEQGADVNHINNNRFDSTALMEAASVNSVEVIDVLLEYGAELDILDNELNPAVSFAAWQGSYDAAVHLVEAGADYTIAGIGGNPLDWARFNGNAELIEYFENLGLKPSNQ